jgi:hypothetical protein
MIKTSSISNEIIDLNKELILADPINYVFSSLLLKQGTKPISSIIHTWKNESLASGANPTSALMLEGADVSNFQESSRVDVSNICQIINKSVSVSESAQAVSLEGISDLFAHELANRILEAKRELEYFLINGVYTEESGTTPRQMKGLVNWITGSYALTAATPTLNDFTAMSKLMRQNGTSANDLVLLCDYNMTDVVNGLFDDKQRYVNVTNEFGNPVVKLNLTYGSCYLYTVDKMPTNTAILVNMRYLQLAELRPLKYYDLARTGSSRKGFIEMENTLMYKHPAAAVKLTIA